MHISLEITILAYITIDTLIFLIFWLMNYISK